MDSDLRQSIRSRSVQYLFNTGMVCAIASNHQEAIIYFECAAAKNLRDWKIYYNLALCYAALEKHFEAIKLFQAAIDIEPKEGRIYFCLANSYKDTKQYVLAIEYFAKVRTLDLNHFASWVNEGQCWQELSQYSVAESCFINAYRIDATRYESYHALGTLFIRQKAYERAIQVLTYGLQNMPDPSSLLYQCRAKVHLLAGDVLAHQRDLNSAEKYAKKA